MKTSPPAALVLYEGNDPGGKRCEVRTAGSETGVQHCIPSVEGDKICAVAVVMSDTCSTWVFNYFSYYYAPFGPPWQALWKGN
jgi:hypothetical protein